jgi:predicted acyltransferase
MTEQTKVEKEAPTEAGVAVQTQVGPIRPIVRPPGSRVLSIDALRGFDMFWLMQEGTGFVLALAVALHLPLRNILATQLRHSEWLGFTFWDFIAPLFLFVVGLSMPFALSRRIAQGADRRALFGHVLKRTVVLIVLGLVFNGILRLDFAHFRYAGVLQRIALSYFFAAVIVLTCRIRGQAIWTAVLLLAYWAMMAFIPVPGIGHGVFTPAGNLEGYIDRLFLPGKFCCFGFGDNEGYLSTIPSIATVMFGVLCGHLVRSSLTNAKKLQILMGGGVASLVAGLLWGNFFPIITKLWTSSYTLYANGWCMLLFALFYGVIDVGGWRKWTFPFVVIGLNSITIYVVQSQFDFRHVSDIFVSGLANHAGEYNVLLLGASVVLVKWLFLYFLYRQEIFLKA